MTMHEAVEANHGKVPLPKELVWDMNRATQAEVDAELRRAAEERRALAGERAQDVTDYEVRDLRRRCLEAGVPDRFVGVAADLTRLDSLGAGRGLYLCGAVGSGKTTTACATLKGWLSERRGTARFASAVRLVEAMGPKGDPAEATAYRKAGLLVMDDLGQEGDYDVPLSRLFDVVDARWAARLPMVVTTQHEPMELEARLARHGNEATAKAIVSRICGSCDLVRTRPRDLRLAGGDGS